MSEYPTEYKLKIPSQTDNLEIIREFVGRVASKVGFNEDDLNKIELAVDEACANVIKHAYQKDQKSKPIDIQVGDFIKFNHNVRFDGSCVKALDDRKLNRLYKADRPGIGRFYSFNGTWAEFVRVSRKEYSGHSLYRHLEEPEDE